MEFRRNTEKTLQEVEEITLTTALDSVSSLTPNLSTEEAIQSSPNPNEFSESATQTPLTLTKPGVTKSTSEKSSIDARTSSANIENVGKTEVSFSLNNTLMNQRLTCDMKETCKIEKSHCSASKLNEVSIKYSCGTTTQATPLHPSLMRTVPTNPRDALQISTSFNSCKSGPKAEILTVTTDYGNQSPDTHSILVDAIDQSGNRGLRLSVQEAFRSPRLSDLLPANRSLGNSLSTDRTSNRRWSLNSFLPCASAANNELDTRSYTRDAPPTYSTIYANGATSRDWRLYRSMNRSPFVAPIPPPSYAQAQGVRLTTYSMDHLVPLSPSTDGTWTPRPTTTLCPRCVTIIVTTIEVRQSTVTHVSALMLFLCGCWPCCMLPYCMNSCKSIDHYCPICRAYLGTYQPW